MLNVAILCFRENSKFLTFSQVITFAGVKWKVCKWGKDSKGCRVNEKCLRIKICSFRVLGLKIRFVYRLKCLKKYLRLCCLHLKIHIHELGVILAQKHSWDLWIIFKSYLFGPMLIIKNKIWCSPKNYLYAEVFILKKILTFLWEKLPLQSQR